MGGILWCRDVNILWHSQSVPFHIHKDGIQVRGMGFRGKASLANQMSVVQWKFSLAMLTSDATRMPPLLPESALAIQQGHFTQKCPGNFGKDTSSPPIPPQTHPQNILAIQQERFTSKESWQIWLQIRQRWILRDILKTNPEMPDLINLMSIFWFFLFFCFCFCLEMSKFTVYCKVSAT